MDAAEAEDILSYWFGLTPEQWWRDTSLDAEIAARFGALWEAERHTPAEDFLGSPREALAAVILLDQFPRNMFRNDARSFATDDLALAIATSAISMGYDLALSQPERGFLYMPFQHSESLPAQARSVALFERLGDAEQLRFARLHRDIIARFGRFPHRNASLGRLPTEEEKAAGDVVPW
jgi:uncharacterized protein (DUF924 family)